MKKRVKVELMNYVKRGILGILSFVFMLSIVGYINYKYDPEREKDLGQTVYVNAKEEYEHQVGIYSEKEQEKKEEIDTISVFKYDRDNMFSELIENYNNIINNANTSSDTVREYQQKLNQLIEKKTLINMVENVIKSKGIEDIVIIPTNQENLNIIVKSEIELEADQIAKIQQIIVDQLGVDANKLSITRNEK